MVSTLVSQREGSGFDPWSSRAFLCGVCMLSPCVHEFHYNFKYKKRTIKAKSASIIWQPSTFLPSETDPLETRWNVTEESHLREICEDFLLLSPSSDKKEEAVRSSRDDMKLIPSLDCSHSEHRAAQIRENQGWKERREGWKEENEADNKEEVKQRRGKSYCMCQVMHGLNAKDMFQKLRFKTGKDYLREKKGTTDHGLMHSNISLNFSMKDSVGLMHEVCRGAEVRKKPLAWNEGILLQMVWLLVLLLTSEIVVWNFKYSHTSCYSGASRPALKGGFTCTSKI